MQELTGTVTYWERIALPPETQLHVVLFAAGDHDETIAELSQPLDGAQVPVPFALAYPASAIDELTAYALRAELVVEDRVAFTTTDPVPVLTQGNPASGIEIRVRTNA